MKKLYLKIDPRNNGIETLNAAQAMQWHRSGGDIAVYTLENGTRRFLRCIDGAQQPEKPDENRRHCKHIAESLEEYVNDCVKRCPHCGEIHVRDWSDVGDVFKCPNCGDVDSVDNWEWLSVWDYLADTYDVEFRIGSDKEVRSVRVMVACGGPNIYINTASGDVELHWWTDTARYGLSRDAINAVNEWAAEYWGCL